VGAGKKKRGGETSINAVGKKQKEKTKNRKKERRITTGNIRGKKNENPS